MLLTVVIAVVGDESTLTRCLEALVPQACDAEVIVPYDDALRVAGVRSRFADVRFLDLGVTQTRAAAGSMAALHERFDKRIAAALRDARGDVVALLQDWEVPAPDWVERVKSAHRLPYAAIGGAVENRGSGLLNWSVYFLDFSRYQLPFAPKPARYLSDVNVSYKRAALERVRDVWRETYSEVAVNWALAERGETLLLTPEIIVYQDRGPLSLTTLVRERASWGIIFGAARGAWVGPMRWLYAAASPLIPFVLIGRVLKDVLRTRRNVLVFVTSLPAMIVLAVSWSVGEFWGYVAHGNGA